MEVIPPIRWFESNPRYQGIRKAQVLGLCLFIWLCLTEDRLGPPSSAHHQEYYKTNSNSDASPQWHP